MFHWKKVPEEFSLREQIWLDITSSLQVKILFLLKRYDASFEFK